MLGGSAKAVGIYASGYKKDGWLYLENQFEKAAALYRNRSARRTDEGFSFIRSESADIEPSPLKFRISGAQRVIERILDNRRIYFLFNCTDQAPFILNYRRKCRITGR